VGAPGNYGELIAPTPLAGEPFERLRGKWLLVTVDASACDARCEKKLYYLRQLRRAQGKDMDRVERVWLVTDGGKPRAELVQAFEGTRIEPAPKLGAFPGRPAEHIYLVDPFGNLMMRYPRDADPSRMLKDLQRLLRVAKGA
jgi:cytochrome oxidase Cu insertion factor (SCO1/SenC/PrrC family)